MFDIFYLGSNKQISTAFPFAKSVSDTSEIKSDTRMYWVVDQNVNVVDLDIFRYRPEEHDLKYTHVWKWNDENYGGLKLCPASDSRGTKEINQVVCKKIFDRLSDATQLPEYFADNPSATHVWVIDPEYRMSSDIDWAPGNFEPNYVHSFHLRGQLEHKYPNEEGGVKLYPRDYSKAKIKYHKFLDAAETYPILYVKNIDDYSQRDIYNDEYVWLIDQEHDVEESTLEWVPNPFETEYNHSFRMPYQLTEKYPDEMGGIRLVHKEWRTAKHKIHIECTVEDRNYDVFFTSKEFNTHTFEYYARRSETDWFWVVDKDFEFTGKLLYVPAAGEREYIHVFKIPGVLEHRYLPSITDLTSGKAAGVYLVNKNFDITKKKLHTDDYPVKYDVFYTSNIAEYETYARKSRTEMFWLIDQKIPLTPSDLKFMPSEDDQSYINQFTVGVALVPRNYDNNKVKTHTNFSGIKLLEFEKFTDEETGRKHSTHDWFWVIDPDVSVQNNFDFYFTPEEWDIGKTHVWQKLNPITGKQYDYDGVRLCHKKPVEQGRPVYMRTPACTQVEYPRIYLSAKQDLIKQLREFELECQEQNHRMYWAVDPYTYVLNEFEFSYYPTQWDRNNVHLFPNADGEYRGVRLIPVGTFMHNERTIKDLIYNRFDDVKTLTEVASHATVWPLVRLDSMNKFDFSMELASQETEFVWTLDPDVELIPEAVENFRTELQHAGRVHALKRVDVNGKACGYGGLRLWDTSLDYSKITSEDLEYNNIPNISYVDEPGSVYKPYDVVFLSYGEQNADLAYEKLLSKAPTAHRVDGVEGIYNAHRAAAELCGSKMFWVVDADAEILDDFDFSYTPDVYDHRTTHVWNSVNPVTGLEYGYGGVKLFNREMVLNAGDWGLDFTTGLGKKFKHMDNVSNITHFNTDAYSTWRSAFRECVKLSLKDDIESKQRLAAWLKPSTDAQFVEDAVHGAEAGVSYATTNRDDPSALAKINDYNFLREFYELSSP